MIGAGAACGNLGDQAEHLVAEPADIDDIRPFLRLGVRVRLDVDRHHLGLRVSRLEILPLPHRLGRPAAESTVYGAIDPRFVVRHVDHQIAHRLVLIQVTQRRTAVRAATRQRRKLCGVGHYRIARVKRYLHDVGLKRDHFGGRVIPDQHLLARINLWTFRLPGLSERREDIEPNLQYELQQFAARYGKKVTFNKEAHQRFLDFCQSSRAVWSANFRDLNAAVTRMATLAPGGRITLSSVDEELGRLENAWSATPSDANDSLLSDLLGPERLAQLDRFDRVQLAEVIRVCRSSKSLSEAGRELFQVSRLEKKVSNDADRLRKYLGSFGLSWAVCR